MNVIQVKQGYRWILCLVVMTSVAVAEQVSHWSFEVESDLALNGGDGAHVTVSDRENLRFDQCESMTVEAWVKYEGSAANRRT